MQDEKLIQLIDESDYEYAKRHFSYDPLSGIIFRIAPTIRSDGRSYTRCVTQPVGWKNPRGYLDVKSKGLGRVKLHRLAWLLQTGSWPSNEIDHINGVRDDNRWSNLRDVSRAVNMQNQHKKRGKSTDLPVGICQRTHRGGPCYSVAITRNGVTRQSTRKTLGEAVELLGSFRNWFDSNKDSWNSNLTCVS